MFWIPPHLLFALVTMIWEKLLPLLPQLTLLGTFSPHQMSLPLWGPPCLHIWPPSNVNTHTDKIRVYCTLLYATLPCCYISITKYHDLACIFSCVPSKIISPVQLILLISVFSVFSSYLSSRMNLNNFFCMKIKCTYINYIFFSV